MLGSFSTPVLLSIAGFDPGAGAGVTADIKTAAAHNCFAISCITALTAQSTQGVSTVHSMPAKLVRQTLDSLAADFAISAVRVGMLGTGEVAEVVAEWLTSYKPEICVLDPVLSSSSGVELLDALGQQLLRTRLLGLTDLVTPNVREAETLSGLKIHDRPSASAAAEKIQRLGSRNVVITGGDLPENSDLLRLRSGQELWIPGVKLESQSTHGTGCAFAAAIACNLALGHGLPEALRLAKDYIRHAIASATPIGKGPHKPMDHLFRLK